MSVGREKVRNVNKIPSGSPEHTVSGIKEALKFRLIAISAVLRLLTTADAPLPPSSVLVNFLSCSVAWVVGELSADLLSMPLPSVLLP